jgi:hypothetical protein
MIDKQTESARFAVPVSAPPWLVGMAIGMTIMTMAAAAMSIGAGLAVTQTATQPGR